MAGCRACRTTRAQAARPARRPHRRRRPASRPTTTGTPTRPTPASGSRSARRATAARASTTPSTRTHIAGDHARRSVEYRARAGHRRARCSSARDTHALSAPALGSALEVLARQRRAGARRQPRRLHADARGLARDPRATTAAARAGLADGDRHHAVAQPAARRRLQVQPAARRARRHRRHRLDRRTAPTSCSPTALDGRAPRVPLDRRARRHAVTTSSAPTSTTCRASSTSTRSARRACGSAPTRSAAPAWHYWGAIARAPRARPDRGQPATSTRRWRFMTLDWDGKIRMDCSSPYAMASLIARRDDYDDRDRQRRRRRPARHRHARRRADEPQPLPRGRDRLPVRAPRRLARRAPRSARPW